MQTHEKMMLARLQMAQLDDAFSRHQYLAAKVDTWGSFGDREGSKTVIMNEIRELRRTLMSLYKDIQKES